MKPGMIPGFAFDVVKVLQAACVCFSWQVTSSSSAKIRRRSPLLPNRILPFRSRRSAMRICQSSKFLHCPMKAWMSSIFEPHRFRTSDVIFLKHASLSWALTCLAKSCIIRGSHLMGGCCLMKPIRANLIQLSFLFAKSRTFFK